MKGYAVSSETKKGCLLYLVFCGCILAGLGAMTCVLYWKLGFDGGVAWRDNPAKQFAWHPILLTLSIVLSGIGGTLYKVLNISKPITKSIHAILMILAAASGAIGLWAVIDSHNFASPPIPNFFSLHSWVGISVLAVLGLQLLFGLIILLFPIPSSKKAGFMPLHKYFGILVFVGSVAAAIIG
ncbi:transmembrane ascorbate ferrireductase 1 [Eurytemora carolleeae]|uniref:transmembrane ascorbate ferrireductase 1 n=1 Tax=Eurytemora carolleeae TaxID=1294199 RepID=UPI000C783B54|nr:transmembrane ascorbate ferrireductase 1 [Eurytemora carolleeae]|eukprot:XP_023338471.1 transmembrane ascorbate ferrireductase 1-like [Eurytemora affinis]